MLPLRVLLLGLLVAVGVVGRAIQAQALLRVLLLGVLIAQRILDAGDVVLRGWIGLVEAFPVPDAEFMQRQLVALGYFSHRGNQVVTRARASPRQRPIFMPTLVLTVPAFNTCKSSSAVVSMMGRRRIRSNALSLPAVRQRI